MKFRIEEQTLSDNSIAFNVVGTDGEHVVTVGATDENAALSLVGILNGEHVAWVQVERAA